MNCHIFRTWKMKMKNYEKMATHNFQIFKTWNGILLQNLSNWRAKPKWWKLVSALWNFIERVVFKFWKPSSSFILTLWTKSYNISMICSPAIMDFNYMNLTFVKAFTFVVQHSNFWSVVNVLSYFPDLCTFGWEAWVSTMEEEVECGIS